MVKYSYLGLYISFFLQILYIYIYIYIYTIHIYIFRYKGILLQFSLIQCQFHALVGSLILFSYFSPITWNVYNFLL